MQDSPDSNLVQSKLAGLAFDSLQQVYWKQDILMMFETHPLPLTVSQTIWLVINPAVGAPQSDYTVVSMCRVKDCVVVRVYATVGVCGAQIGLCVMSSQITSPLKGPVIVLKRWDCYVWKFARAVGNELRAHSWLRRIEMWKSLRMISDRMRLEFLPPWERGSCLWLSSLWPPSRRLTHYSRIFCSRITWVRGLSLGHYKTRPLKSETFIILSGVKVDASPQSHYPPELTCASLVPITLLEFAVGASKVGTHTFGVSKIGPQSVEAAWEALLGPLFLFFSIYLFWAALLATSLACHLLLCPHWPISPHSPTARHFSTSTFSNANLWPSACLLISITIFSLTRSLTIWKLSLTTVVDLFLYTSLSASAALSNSHLQLSGLLQSQKRNQYYCYHPGCPSPHQHIHLHHSRRHQQRHLHLLCFHSRHVHLHRRHYYHSHHQPQYHPDQTQRQCPPSVSLPLRREPHHHHDSCYHHERCRLHSYSPGCCQHPLRCYCPYKLCLYLEHIELPAKLLDYFLRSNISNINQSVFGPRCHLVREICSAQPTRICPPHHDLRYHCSRVHFQCQCLITTTFSWLLYLTINNRTTTTQTCCHISWCMSFFSICHCTCTYVFVLLIQVVDFCFHTFSYIQYTLLFIYAFISIHISIIIYIYVTELWCYPQ